LYYLKKDFSSLVNVSKSVEDLLSKLNKTSYSNSHAWTSFRIAYSYDKLNSNLALDYYKKAVELAPYVLKFRLKLGDFYSKSQDLDNAEKQYRLILDEFSKNENVWCNLGYILVQKNNFDEANSCYDKALALNPVHIQSLLNKASLLIIQGDINKGKLYLNRILEIDSKNEKVKSIMSSL
jgi:tetratricopeptide (TPR) repeat protein